MSHVLHVMRSLVLTEPASMEISARCACNLGRWIPSNPAPNPEFCRCQPQPRARCRDPRREADVTLRLELQPSIGGVCTVPGAARSSFRNGFHVQPHCSASLAVYRVQPVAMRAANRCVSLVASCCIVLLFYTTASLATRFDNGSLVEVRRCRCLLFPYTMATSPEPFGQPRSVIPPSLCSATPATPAVPPRAPDRCECSPSDDRQPGSRSHWMHPLLDSDGYSASPCTPGLGLRLPAVPLPIQKWADVAILGPCDFCSDRSAGFCSVLYVGRASPERCPPCADGPARGVEGTFTESPPPFPEYETITRLDAVMLWGAVGDRRSARVWGCIVARFSTPGVSRHHSTVSRTA